MSYEQTEREVQLYREAVREAETAICNNAFWDVMEIKEPSQRVLVPLNDALEQLYQEAFENGRVSMENELKRNGLL